MNETLLGAVLVFARLGGLVWTLPVFSSAGMPRAVRIFIALAATSLLAPVVPSAAPGSAGTLLVALLFELAFGLAGGWLVSVAFSAISSASELVAYQAGLAMASQFNPVDKSSYGAVGTLCALLVGLVYIGSNLHLVALEGVALGFWSHPAGSLPWSTSFPGLALAVIEQAFGLALQLAAPIVAMTFSVNAMIGLLGRIAPKMNAFLSFGPTLSIVGGLWLLAASLPWILASEGEFLAITTRLLIRMGGG